MNRTASMLGILFAAFCNFELLFADYSACGTNDASGEDSPNINTHVQRLMQLRRSDSGWLNTPEVVLSIQLASPALFSGKNNTVNRLMEEIEYSINNITVGRLALYAMAAKSLCRDATDFNGVDIVEKLRQKLEEQFILEGAQLKSPRSGWYGFYLAMGAYCVTSGGAPEDTHIHRALHAQNRDGSFGKGHSVDVTSNAMLSLLCLKRSAQLPTNQQKQIQRAMRKASGFLLTQIAVERGDVWIGDKYSSPNAVLAIKEHSNWEENSWRCKLVLKSMDLAPDSNERESAIAQRLLALKGVSYLSMLSDGLQCGEEGTAFVTIAPTTQSPKTSCSGLESSGHSHHLLHFLTMIDVHIKIHTTSLPLPAGEDGEPVVVSVRNVKKGNTLLEILKLAQCRGLLTFQTDKTSWGEFVTSLEGRMADPGKKEYWQIQSNGESVPVGIGQFVPSHADRISFRTKKW